MIKTGIKVQTLGAIETNCDKYGHTHVVVIYSVIDDGQLLAWPTTGSDAYFTPEVGKKHTITFKELCDDFLKKSKVGIKRISYVKYL